jgi:transposase
MLDWEVIEEKAVQEQEKAMEKEQRGAAKRQMIALMQAGHPWKEAAAIAGLHIGRSAAYQLLQKVRTRGEAAWQDGRHGHPAKLREAVRQWLETTCRETPHLPSREVQAALQEQFGILVSIGHLNRIRAQLGVGSRVVHREKNFQPPVHQMSPTGKREQLDSFC